MEIVAKISKGSKMDQIYISKNRIGLEIGSYVLVRPVEQAEKRNDKPYFYNINSIGNVKLEIAREIFDFIDKEFGECENVIITGSFVDEGFGFNDVDVLIVSSKKVNEERLRKKLAEEIGIETHVIVIDNKSLIEGMATDPIYQMMLSKCIARKRFVYKTGRKINYKILDLHLLKSRVLIDSFDALDGNEKYDLVRNMIAIYLFLLDKKVSREIVDKEIQKIFGLENAREIRLNMLVKEKFLKKYQKIYRESFERLIRGIKNGAKSK
ncbi:hypothetical protein J4402_05040 [Candidatus Pacearchaeota archaeon]|nr:hypothetical protein [Candidatus Pacearchaeota archaeon]